MLRRTFTTLPILQALIVEVEAVFNNRPLTYLSFDIKDPQPLTPYNLIYGHRIVMLPHLLCKDDETTDEFFQIGESDSLLRKGQNPNTLDEALLGEMETRISNLIERISLGS